MNITLLDFVIAIFQIIGAMVVLHYVAYSIAWGVAKGWGKVRHEVHLNVKGPEEKPNYI